MSSATGHWYPVLSSRELGKRPIGRTRFGLNLVFWRTGDGTVICMPDRCPHRGAALSLGRIQNDSIACPFHGIEFGANGKCTHVPVEPERSLPGEFGVQTLRTAEDNGYIWLWRGENSDLLPPLPAHSELENMRYGEHTSVWNAHYTRCIENVCDYSHLPFVHKTTIGMFKKNYICHIEMEDLPNGFRAHLVQNNGRNQCLEFIYPNMWNLKVPSSLQMTAVFAPIDEHSTQVYGRTWYPLSVAGIRPLMDAYTRFSQFLVFREDWPIVASQTPWNVADVTDERLLPSDAPVIAYRKLLHADATLPKTGA
jgi:phenylpropionate dioxygenase-like ring-hydroxylating dioxygenase large terminal subunit